MLAEENVAPLGILAKRIGFHVEIDGAGQGVGDDRRGFHEVVLRHVGGNTSLEIPISRQHARQFNIAADAMHLGQDGP